jgi:predicted NAD-dependent protein-ADP-ribosyltransferase YbiA (DUF1768 family)
MESDCRNGMDFNQKTCRYVNPCKNGYSRNKDFKCVKDPTAPKRPIAKKKLSLAKTLFSNSNGSNKSNGPRVKVTFGNKTRTKAPSKKRPPKPVKRKSKISKPDNGLYNSPPSPKLKPRKSKTSKHVPDNGLYYSTSPLAKSKRLTKKVKYANLLYNSNGNEIPPIPTQKQLLEQKMKEVIEDIGPDIANMTFGQIKAIARSKGLDLDVRSQKKLYKNKAIEYFESLGIPRNNNIEELLNKVPNESRPKAKSSKVMRVPGTKATAKTKASEKANGINELFDTEFARPKGKSAKSTNAKATVPYGVSRPTKRTKITGPERVTPNSRLNANNRANSGLSVQSALSIMDLSDKYTRDDLGSKFREKSLSIHPDKSFAEKKLTPEYKRIDKAFKVLSKKFTSNVGSRYGNEVPLLSKLSGIPEEAFSEPGQNISNLTESNRGVNRANEPNINHFNDVPIPSDGSIINMNVNGLYKSDTVFKFYSQSSDRAPGRGAGEKLNPGDDSKYARLSQIPNWRKMLSNFWIEPFNLEGKRWQTAEHYYQASKFKGTPDFYNQFSLDSGSDLSKSPDLAKAAGGKSGKRKGERVRPKEIKMDSDFFPDRSKIEMFKAQHAKFTQGDALATVLKLTRDAKLVHHVRGSPPVSFNNLMYIRSKL